MTGGYINLKLSKIYKNWGAYILILFLFLLDSALGNMYKLFEFENQLTDAFRYVRDKEIFHIVPYLMLLFRVNLKFDKFDNALLYGALFLTVINWLDFYADFNLRKQLIDWVCIATVVIPTFILKFKTYER